LGQTKIVADKVTVCDFKIIYGDGVFCSKDTCSVIPFRNLYTIRLNGKETKDLKEIFPIKKGQVIKLSKENLTALLESICTIDEKTIIAVIIHPNWDYRPPPAQSKLIDFDLTLDYNFRH
jgi:hypothetical protein